MPHFAFIALVSVAVITSPLARLAAAIQMRPTVPANSSAAWVAGSNFTVDVHGKKLGVFHKISGMASGLQDQAMGRTARGRFGNVTLYGGDAQSLQAFEKWRQQAVDGKVGAAHQTVTITVSDAKSRAVARYKLVNAWPIKVSGGSPAANGPTAQMTTVDLGYEDIQTLP